MDPALASMETGEFSESYPMKGGDGRNSYANNSIMQRGVVDAAKQLLHKALEENLDLNILLSASKSNSTFCIADLGCSVGPNTFYSIKNILEGVESKSQEGSLKYSKIIPAEFQVFFNDQTPNDFNLLFKSLPPSRPYYAAGVPGSFYGRLFPKASIHFVHSSYALHWLSRVPKAVTEKNSPAWNKGRIGYSNSPVEVVKAYEAQFAEDMECFLYARAQEVVPGGLMSLIIPGRSLGAPLSHSMQNMNYQFIGSALMELASKGIVQEEKVDSFSIPTYSMSPHELEASVERNGCFSMERMESLPYVPTFGESTSAVSKGKAVASHLRAVFEEPIKHHFGDEIIDDLFELYGKKLDESPPSVFKAMEGLVFFALLKRKAN